MNFFENFDGKKLISNRCIEDLMPILIKKSCKVSNENQFNIRISSWPSKFKNKFDHKMSDYKNGKILMI